MPEETNYLSEICAGSSKASSVTCRASNAADLTDHGRVPFAKFRLDANTGACLLARAASRRVSIPFHLDPAADLPSATQEHGRPANCARIFHNKEKGIDEARYILLSNRKAACTLADRGHKDNWLIGKRAVT